MRSGGFSRRLAFAPPYDAQFAGLPAFATLQGAERTLTRLEELRQRYLALGDRVGLECCRRTALLARRRAEGIAANPRVADAKRAIKAEIGSWFAVWLETPELFEPWLRLRQQTAQYRELTLAEKSPSA